MLNVQGRVLFVGNDQELSRLLVKILQRMNCQVTAATTDSALAMIANFEYDCVLVDFTNISGDFEFQNVCRCLRQVAFLSRNLPIILFADVAPVKDGQPASKQVGEKSYSILSIDSLVKQALQEVNDKSNRGVVGVASR